MIIDVPVWVNMTMIPHDKLLHLALGLLAGMCALVGMLVLQHLGKRRQSVINWK